MGYLGDSVPYAEYVLVFSVVLMISFLLEKWNLRESMIVLHFDEIEYGRTGQTYKSQTCERKPRIVDAVLCMKPRRRMQCSILFESICCGSIYLFSMQGKKKNI